MTYRTSLMRASMVMPGGSATAPPRGRDEFCLTVASHISCCPQESSAVPEPSPTKSTRIRSAIPPPRLRRRVPQTPCRFIFAHVDQMREILRLPVASGPRQGWAARTGFQDRPPGYRVELPEGTVGRPVGGQDQVLLQVGEDRLRVEVDVPDGRVALAG